MNVYTNAAEYFDYRYDQFISDGYQLMEAYLFTKDLIEAADYICLYSHQSSHLPFPILEYEFSDGSRIVLSEDKGTMVLWTT